MKAIFSIVFSIFTITFSFGQTQGVAYTAAGKGVATTFVTDYHCLGINNSALGWGTGYEKKKFTMGMTEFGVGIYSDSLNKDKLSKLYRTIRNDVTGKEQDGANWQEQANYAADYLESGVSIDAHYNWLGFSFQTEKFGGIAFNVQEQYSWYSRLNEETTDIIFRGKLSGFLDSLTLSDGSVIANSENLSDDTLEMVVEGKFAVPLQLSELTKGSDIRFSWNRYYNFGYGKKLFGDSTFALFAGIGGRFIQSTAVFNMSSDEDGLKFYSSISPSYDIDYGAIANSNPSTYTQTGSIPKTVGNGYGLDFSVSARMFNRLKVGVAVNNIGSVTYKRNVYRVSDTLISRIELDGLQNYNITDALDQFLDEGGLINLVGEEEVVVQNAANIRLGASLDFGKMISVGIDVVAPFNTNNPGGLQNAVFSAGGDVRPVKWLTLSAGYYGGGIYAHNIPVGINFILGGGTYEFGISSRDALSFFMKDSNSVSTAFGVARFRF